MPRAHPYGYRCGTRAGFEAHRRKREPQCEPCRVANRTYQRDHAEATRRALLALRLRHPEEYAGLLARSVRELAEDRRIDEQARRG